MPPILKRLRKPAEAKAPDLATLLEPYGNREDDESESSAAAQAPEAGAEAGAQDEAS